MDAGLSALKNAELTVLPASFVGPLQPDRVAAFLGRLDALPSAGAIDRVLSQATSAGSHNRGLSARPAITSLVKSQFAAGWRSTPGADVETEAVAEQWTSPIDDDLLATLTASRR